MTTNEQSPGLDPSFVFNPADPAFEADPYPTYALLRERAPVYAWPLGHCIILSKFDDVSAALRDQRLSTNPSHWEFAQPKVPDAEKSEYERVSNDSLLLLSGVDHARLRRLVGPAFTPRAVERMRGDVQEIVDEALAQNIDEGGASIDVAKLADFIPLRVISRVLGIPKELDPEFRRFGGACIEVFNPLLTPEEKARIMEPIPAGFALVRRVIADRKKALGDDLLSSLIRAEEAGDRLSEEEVVGLVSSIIVGGAETAVHFIAYSILNLLRHPKALAEVRAEPSLTRGAVEEVLRYDSFVKVGVARYAMEDITIRGVTIPRGKMILPLTAGANRDPDAYRDPDVFDIHRASMDHLTFGAGPHLCLGASVARLEAEVTTATLLRRFPEMRLASEPTYGPHPYLRRITSLRVRVRDEMREAAKH